MAVYLLEFCQYCLQENIFPRSRTKQHEEERNGERARGHVKNLCALSPRLPLSPSYLRASSYSFVDEKFFLNVMAKL